MRNVIKLIDQAYGWFSARCQCLPIAPAACHPALLGLAVLAGGLGKAMNIPHVIEYFTSLGVPAPALNAYFISWLEVVGGILLALGLCSRLIALPLTIDMAVAFVVGDREALGSIFSDPDKFYAASPYTFLFASLLILCFGPGKLSLDALIVWYRKKRAPSSEVAGI